MTNNTKSGLGRRMRAALLAGCALAAAPALALAAPAAGQPAAIPASVASASAPRVFALSVGISDYGGDGSNNLEYTAEDARNIAQSLRNAGVLAPQSEVITERAATVEAVRAAFSRIAAQVGPNDVFLFFYSGHGGQTDVRVSATEPDGRAETLVMRDGDITDTDLAQMFDTIHAGVSIVALDSCFSGGFARNVVNRPGVMGLFSSEEDLTSAVAENFRAGGYLSHFLISGLAGSADGNRDGVITAGELSTYLHHQFSTQVQNVSAETTDGQQNYQNLVIDRGAVQIDAPLLRLASTRMARADDADGKPDGDVAAASMRDDVAGPAENADQQDWSGDDADQVQDGSWAQGGDDELGGGKPEQ